MGYLESDSLLLILLLSEKPWTLAANKSGMWFRRVEDAAKQYMKRLFTTEKEKQAKRQELEV